MYKRQAQDEDALTTEALKNVVSVDYKEYFGDLDGSFVLYDMQEDTWYVYNRAQAERRISPDSTYKVYDALFGLEEGVIAPDASVLPWDGTAYPFCLLYTSDAADDLLCVDLGGRRIIQKKKHKTEQH